ncbi:uncharacterized protein H6S33_005685 [Morchella sextelata]|uniref:uncharacterized protein n=1 Tax=Morchella sextelata TaxID=1174677 RepID=UPI001D05A276|nr:uncharacterized protein H6S33_005685 [Morchella sextelata]KAH0613799.1 hypothetical protein H6S33_005685 [Morchella sextelata]
MRFDYHLSRPGNRDEAKDYSKHGIISITILTRSINTHYICFLVTKLTPAEAVRTILSSPAAVILEFNQSVFTWYSHSGSGSLGSLEPTIHLRFRFTGNCATYVL